jgi:transcriptional regulator with XRE-family HTH domain
MSDRTPLTQKLARKLKAARNVKGLSQYELADELNWPRSKIKRIEKAEVKTVDVEDLTKLEGVLFVKSVKEPVKTGSKPVKTGMFRSSTKLDRTMGPHLKFVRVEMAVVARPGELLGERVMFGDIQGAIHGVENSAEQDPLKPGHVLDLAIWVGP